MLKWTIIVGMLLTILIAAPCFALGGWHNCYVVTGQEQMILGGQGQAQGGLVFNTGDAIGITGYQGQIAGATTGQNQHLCTNCIFGVSADQSQSVSGKWEQEQYRESLIGVGWQGQSSYIRVSGHQNQSSGFISPPVD